MTPTLGKVAVLASLGGWLLVWYFSKLVKN